MWEASSNLVTGAAWNSPNDSPTYAAVAVLGDHFRHRGALRWTAVRVVAVQGTPPRVVLGPNGLGIWSLPGAPAWKANPGTRKGQLEPGMRAHLAATRENDQLLDADDLLSFLAGRLPRLLGMRRHPR